MKIKSQQTNKQKNKLIKLSARKTAKQRTKNNWHSKLEDEKDEAKYVRKQQSCVLDCDILSTQALTGYILSIFSEY